jgi:hypothetical protein
VLALAAVLGCNSSDVSRDLGARCDVNGDCNGLCLTGGAWPGGFCTVACDTDPNCLSDAHCVDENGGVCMFACAINSDCRFLGAGYTCQMETARGGTGAMVMVCHG